jgi:AraC-like DNA-binding protein
MERAATASNRGILRPHEGHRHFRLTREPPSPDLARWVERHWMVEWDLQEPYTQELLNHPTVNVAVEPATAGVHGIRTERDRQTIAGTGRVVGIKLRPGAFQPFYGRSVHQLTNRILPLAAVFGPDGDELAARHAMSQRTLQRLFRRYVGVSPKWVLQRYRLHEAAERIAEGRDGDWAATALELGYFDQAHFIRDFKALIGASPAQYAGAAA